jgi:hypothetical protein
MTFTEFTQALQLAAISSEFGDLTIPVKVTPSGKHWRYEFAGFVVPEWTFPAFENCQPIDQTRVKAITLKPVESRTGNLQIQQFSVDFETSDAHAVKKSAFGQVVEVASA